MSLGLHSLVIINANQIVLKLLFSYIFYLYKILQYFFHGYLTITTVFTKNYYHLVQILNLQSAIKEPLININVKKLFSTRYQSLFEKEKKIFIAVKIETNYSTVENT